MTLKVITQKSASQRLAFTPLINPRFLVLQMASPLKWLSSLVLAVMLLFAALATTQAAQINCKYDKCDAYQCCLLGTDGKVTNQCGQQYANRANAVCKNKHARKMV